MGLRLKYRALPLAVEDHLHAGRVFQLPPAADRRGQRRHHGLGVRFQKFDGQIDRTAGDLGLVALDVDDDVDVRHAPGDFGHAVGAAGGIGVGHFRPAAKGLQRP